MQSKRYKPKLLYWYKSAKNSTFPLLSFVTVNVETRKKISDTPVKFMYSIYINFRPYNYLETWMLMHPKWLNKKKNSL
jgi:hypothetical protein